MAEFKPTYANLSPYQKGVGYSQLSPLDALLNGAQQGLELQQLPGKLQDQALARELNNALNQQRLYDLQNPEAALARELQKLAIKESVTNPNSGIIQSPIPGQIIATPNTINQTAVGLEAALQSNPAMAIPTAAPNLPITPIGAGTVQTGLSIDQNVPLEAELRKYQNQENLVNYRGQQAANLAQLRAEAAQALLDKRGTQAESLLDKKGTQAESLLDRKQTFTGEQNDLNRSLKGSEGDKNRQNRLDIASKRAKLVSTDNNAKTRKAENNAEILLLVDDLAKDVGLDTVGFADWFKGIPTTDSKYFATRLDTLKSKISLGVLAEMKEASKTGGSGLGAVSNYELKTLQNSIAALDQSLGEDQFNAELQKIRDSIARWNAYKSADTSSTAPAATPSLKKDSLGLFN